MDIYGAQKLYEPISEKGMMMRADPLRHPLIFYYGHTAVFFINKLRLAKARMHLSLSFFCFSDSCSAFPVLPCLALSCLVLCFLAVVHSSLLSFWLRLSSFLFGTFPFVGCVLLLCVTVWGYVPHRLLLICARHRSFRR